MKAEGAKAKERIFSSYEVFVIAILAILQFSVILDFMILSPIGVFVMPELHIDTTHFGLVVSVYAFSAGTSGLLAAGFADKFDRKKLLLFFYVGFIAGTLLCAIADTYEFLLLARIVTGIFGGVVGSVGMAIITDLFKPEVRGRVMGFTQMAFAASQILGLPIGLILANHFGWHSPFWMIVGFSLLVVVVIIIYMKPIVAHLGLKAEHSAFVHLFNTLKQPHYLRAFLATALLATGGYMLMPFGSNFSIFNLGLTRDQLPLLYGITGVATIASGPLLGKLSDKTGRYILFCIGTVISGIMVAIYTNLGVTPLWIIILINVILFVGIMSRIISSSALMTSIPSPKDRGAFMSVNSSVQSYAGAMAAGFAGYLVVQTETGKMEHYNRLGFVVIGTMAITVVMMYFLDRYVKREAAKNAEHKKNQGSGINATA